VVYPPQPRQFDGFTLDEETVEFVPLGWFELRVRPHAESWHAMKPATCLSKAVFGFGP
jgi:hypothetical protein